jgi:hypothetical protein
MRGTAASGGVTVFFCLGEAGTPHSTYHPSQNSARESHCEDVPASKLDAPHRLQPESPQV